MRKYFVKFLSPGTLFAEETVKPIDSWDIEKAVSMSADIIERYGAKPYGFCFITRERTDDDLDSRITDTSCTYYLGGIILTLADIEARGNDADSILIGNMKANKWDRAIENCNSWKVVFALNEGDVVLNVNPQN